MNHDQITIKMVLDRWNASLKNFENILDALTDEQLRNEISPGKNTGVYLLGHLVAVHDDMIALLDFGQKLYPSWEEPFITSPDKSGHTFPSIEELKDGWKKMNAFLGEKIEKLSADGWFEGHTRVSAEDFAKEPHRNKLNIMITRTSHLQYHTGQVVLLKPKAERD